MTKRFEVLRGKCPKCGGRLIHNNTGIECGELRCDYQQHGSEPYRKTDTCPTPPEPQPPMELVEKVAEAIHQCHFHPSDHATARWKEIFEREKILYHDMAKAALSVIMPDLVKVRAIVDELVNDLDYDQSNWNGILSGNFKRAWKAALDKMGVK